jgi:hypothetical protein
MVVLAIEGCEFSLAPCRGRANSAVLVDGGRLRCSEKHGGRATTLHNGELGGPTLRLNRPMPYGSVTETARHIARATRIIRTDSSLVYDPTNVCDPRPQNFFRRINGLKSLAFHAYAPFALHMPLKKFAKFPISAPTLTIR